MKQITGFLAVALLAGVSAGQVRAEGSLWERDQPPPELRQLESRDAFKPAPSVNRRFLRTSVGVQVDPHCLEHIGEIPQEDVAQALAGFFHAAVEDGLDRLDAAAPSVAAKARANAVNSIVTLTCFNPKDTLGYHDRYDEAINISHLKKAAYTLLSDRPGQEDLRSILSEKGLLLSPDKLLAMRRTAFHEFLHLAGIDNLKAAEHNRIGRGPFAGRVADRVYSCAYVAFPEPGQDLMPGFLRTCRD